MRTPRFLHLCQVWSASLGNEQAYGESWYLASPPVELHDIDILLAKSLSACSVVSACERILVQLELT